MLASHPVVGNHGDPRPGCFTRQYTGPVGVILDEREFSKLQPGDALYGYYVNAGQPGSEPTSLHACVNVDAPPFLIVHGALDTLVLREDAYAELPGTQHNFDFFHSMRFHSITDAIVRFAELTAGAGRVERSKRQPITRTGQVPASETRPATA